MSTTPLHLPLAYHLTLRLYGTWLPGDPRGWRSRTEDTRQDPSPGLAEDCRRRLRYAPLRLTPAWREVVETAIRDQCAFRAWALHALRVQSNHVHVVVAAPVAPEIAVGDLKRHASKHLRAHAPELKEREIWARHASTGYLYDCLSVDNAIGYVLDDHHAW